MVTGGWRLRQTGSPRQRNGTTRRRSSVWDQEEEQAEEEDEELLMRVFDAWRAVARDSLAQKDAMEKGLAAMAAQDYMSTSMDLDMFVKRVVMDYWKRVLVDKPARTRASVGLKYKAEQYLTRKELSVLLTPSRVSGRPTRPTATPFSRQPPYLRDAENIPRARSFANRTLRFNAVREAVPHADTRTRSSMHDSPDSSRMEMAIRRKRPTCFSLTLTRADLTDHTGLLVVNEMELNECRARLGLEVDSKAGSRRRSVSSLVFKRLALATPSLQSAQVLQPRHKNMQQSRPGSHSRCRRRFRRPQPSKPISSPGQDRGTNDLAALIMSADDGTTRSPQSPAAPQVVRATYALRKPLAPGVYGTPGWTTRPGHRLVMPSSPRQSGLATRPRLPLSRDILVLHHLYTRRKMLNNSPLTAEGVAVGGAEKDAHARSPVQSWNDAACWTLRFRRRLHLMRSKGDWGGILAANNR